MVDIADRAATAADIHLRQSLAYRKPTSQGASEIFFCTECDEMIPEARRKAMPGVSLCVHCQEEFEKAERPA